jgi:uncharacterized protein (TIGR00290 family)
LKKRVVISWSSGKDSAWTLHKLRQSDEYQVTALLTTVTRVFDRVAIHGVRQDLLVAQADSARLPLWVVPLPWPCSNEQYEVAMGNACTRALKEGVEIIAFGDLFLEDVRRYREEKMRQAGLAPIFPLWKYDTKALVQDMWQAGVRTCIVCVDTKQMPPYFAGRDLDPQLVAEFPPGVDPCGENGEFHTFVYAGPMFSKSIPIKLGNSESRDGFEYTDVLLREHGEGPLPG